MALGEAKAADVDDEKLVSQSIEGLKAKAGKLACRPVVTQQKGGLWHSCDCNSTSCELEGVHGACHVRHIRDVC